MKIKYEIIEVVHECLDTTLCYTTTDLKKAFKELERLENELIKKSWWVSPEYYITVVKD